jgi:hypothetical protein
MFMQGIAARCFFLRYKGLFSLTVVAQSIAVKLPLAAHNMDGQIVRNLIAYAGCCRWDKAK